MITVQTPRGMKFLFSLLGLATLAHGTINRPDPAWKPGAPCPTSISPHVGGSIGDWCALESNSAYCRFPNTTVIHSALIHCPAVEELDISFEVGGCTGPEVDRWDLPIELLRQGQKYPPLKRLRLDGYSFGGLWARSEEEPVDPREVTDVKLYEDEWDDYDPVRSLNQYIDAKNAEIQRSWERNGKPRTNLDMWLEAMDWSQLEDLCINTARSEMVELTSKLPHRLPSLKTLNLNSFPFIQALKPHTLKNLTWIGKTKPAQLEQLLLLQGKSLKSVEYRCDESLCPDWPQHINISAIADLAPHLQHISLNMPRANATWPFPQLEALARIPTLTSAELFFRMVADCEVYAQYLGGCFRCGNAWREWREESGRTGYCRGEERYAVPLLDVEAARDMFEYVRERKRGAELEKVVFKAGDWTGPYDGPLRVERFPYGQQMMIVCRAGAGQSVCETVEREDED